MTVYTLLAERFTRLASRRMQRRYPEWAVAIEREHDSLAGGEGQLRWAFGALQASFALAPPDVSYPAALGLSLAAMTLYQWSADEGLMTVVVLSGLGLALGFLRPKWFLVSGLAVGVVVAAVNGFEWLSGIRPDYETYPRTVANSVQWLSLVIPAIASSAAGRQIGQMLRA